MGACAGQAPVGPAIRGCGLAESAIHAVLNPLRSEREAFRFLLYVVAVAIVVAALVLLGRAIF